MDAAVTVTKLLGTVVVVVQAASSDPANSIEANIAEIVGKITNDVDVLLRSKVCADAAATFAWRPVRC
jgi:hypothetical protein